MKYLSRNKVYQKLEANKDARKIYIFCEGEKREMEYFRYFQGFSSTIEIIPIPSENGLSDPTKLMENAEKLFFDETPHYLLSKEQGDEVWFVIDTDRWNEKNKIATLRDHCSNKNGEEKPMWLIAQSNPCFEIWLYYHFFDLNPNEEHVRSGMSFKQYVSTVIPGGFDSRSMPVAIQSAILNAEQHYEEEGSQPVIYTTEVFKLGKVILPYIKEALDLILAPLKKDPAI
ncbi:RloB family protein [Chitinophaga pinensis]|uniref:RloB domain-containing protein n=1 Tax=Chitinophaga pinensis TaxID=79329 RepID=A0A5C6LUQ1_9BACT|nr:RloB family protein [Chitinophaga pinensis]TWW00991.1 RloB domain-containing protein [Chitinophaga pinensis]